MTNPCDQPRLPSSVMTKPNSINRECIYLASDYTDTANDACTRVVTTISSCEGPEGVEKILKIKGIKDDTECAKVTDACLIRRRGDGDLDFEATKEYDGMSDNISRGGEAVYLLWKTVRTK